MSYEIVKNYRNDTALRNSFNDLAKETFGLDFEPWYQNGFWNEKYIPYSVLKDGKIIANISVNLIDGTLNGEPKHYIQLGTVMTDKNYRNQGYSRKLTEKIFEDFPDCDGFYLYANDEVLDFYPKFGFVKTDEYRFRKTVNISHTHTAEPVPMNSKEDWTKVLTAKKTLRSNGIFQPDTDDLLMFYLTQFMQENVFFIKKLNTYVIAEQDGETLTLHEIYSEQPVDIITVCESFGNIKTVEFAFTPLHSEQLEKYKYQEKDTTFFTLGEPLTADLSQILSLPSTTHA